MKWRCILFAMSWQYRGLGDRIVPSLGIFALFLLDAELLLQEIFQMDLSTLLEIDGSYWGEYDVFVQEI